MAKGQGLAIQSDSQRDLHLGKPRLAIAMARRGENDGSLVGNN